MAAGEVAVPPPPPGFQMIPAPPPGFQLVPAQPEPSALKRRAGEFLSGANDVILGATDAAANAMIGGQRAVATGLSKLFPGVGRSPEEIAAIPSDAPQMRDLLPRNEPTDATGRALNAAGGAVPIALASAAAVPAAIEAAAPALGPVASRVADLLRINSGSALVQQGFAAAGGGAAGQAADDAIPEGEWYKPLAKVVASLGGSALGSAVSGVPSAAGRLVTPVRSQLNTEEARLAAVAAQEGIDLSPAARTGSRPLQTMESVMGTLPLTAGPQREAVDRTVRQFNRAVLSRAGIDAERASPEVLRANAERLSREFERISAATVVRADDQLLSDLQEVATRYGTKMPSQLRQQVGAWIDDILGAGDVIPGRVYQQARSDLTKQFKGQLDKDPLMASALRGIRDALDDAADRAIPQELREAWDAARSQYAAKSVIERAMAGGQGAQAASGNIPTGALKQAVASGDRRAFAQGRGQLTDLARVGEKFVRDPVPNSGTPERTMMANLLTGGVAGSGALSGDPMTALAMPALALGLPRVAQAAYQSPLVERYLTNTVLPPSQRDELARVLARQMIPAAIQESR